MINIEIREYARKMQTNNKQEQYLLDLDKFAGVKDQIMICVAWQLLSHQSYSFIVLITSFSMIKENRLSRKKFIDERKEREREREKEKQNDDERTLENDTKTKPRDQARGPSPTPTLSQKHFVLHEENI